MKLCIISFGLLTLSCVSLHAMKGGLPAEVFSNPDAYVQYVTNLARTIQSRGKELPLNVSPDKDEYNGGFPGDDGGFPKENSDPRHRFESLIPSTAAFNKAIDDEQKRADHYNCNIDVKTLRLKPDSFNDTGKMVLLLSMQAWHDAAKFVNVHTGLAKIFDDIPANAPGIEALIHDADALTYATESYDFLQGHTTYPTLTPTFEQIESQKYEGAQPLAADIQRIMTQILLYPRVVATSDIRMPADNIGMAFMGTDNKTNGRILTFNKDIDAQVNNIPARGTALAYAYCLQQFLSK